MKLYNAHLIMIVAEKGKEAILPHDKNLFLSYDREKDPSFLSRN